MNKSIDRVAILSGKENWRRSRFERRNQEFGFVYEQFEMSIRNPIGIINTGVWHPRREIQAGEEILGLSRCRWNSNPQDQMRLPKKSKDLENGKGNESRIIGFNFP